MSHPDTAPGGPVRIIAADGRTVRIRAVERGDVEGLGRLFDGLEPEDRHHRFFSLYRPPREFLERMTTVADRGGFGLVAVADPAGSARLVGEASYSPLPGGDGELGITVASGWRGWMGPVLLDLLCSAAAERGVADIQAEVEMTNGPMLAVLRGRGGVIMGHTDRSTVRMVVATRGRNPSWPSGRDGPRVLIEVPGGRWHRQDQLETAGATVLACPGPQAAGRRCPVLDGSSCPLAATADVVVVCPPATDTGPWSELLRAHPARHPAAVTCLALPDGTVQVLGGPTLEPPGSVVDVGRLLPGDRAGGIDAGPAAESVRG